ncbi:MarR family transcriptional regulator [Kineococcus endophyticus]|uniref:MarR family transcriptional regulator n=1 Tax=Kineococcus endophyticus TaxID=1181883 RepID=A0ABV3P451_9ACTN
MPEEMVPGLSPVVVAVREVMHASRELGNRIARGSGRSATDTTALGLLDMYGPLGPAELAGHLGISTASATALVDRLEEAGDVHRVAHPTDRRRVVVHLETATRERERAVWTPVVADIDAAARELPPGEQEVVRAWLVRLADLLARHP